MQVAAATIIMERNITILCEQKKFCVSCMKQLPEVIREMEFA